MKLFPVLIFALFVSCLNAQYATDHSAMSITKDNDNRLVFCVALEKDHKRPKASASYAYYYRGAIHENESGHTGYLLNGKFEETNRAGSLLVQGNYTCGLKHGLWKFWDASGMLISQEKWRNGRLVKSIEPQIPQEKIKSTWFKNLFLKKEKVEKDKAEKKKKVRKEE